jgi:hypothetical protein
MQLQSIYFVAEIISAVAVIASLIFVGVQLRQTNTQTTQANKIASADSQRDLLKTASAWLLLTLDKPRVLNDVRQALMEYDTASHETKANFGSWAWSFLLVMEQCVYMKEHDLITASSFSGFETATLGIIVTPGGSQWWTHSKKTIGVAVSEHLDRRLSELGGVTPPIYELMTQFAPFEAHNERGSA